MMVMPVVVMPMMMVVMVHHRRGLGGRRRRPCRGGRRRFLRERVAREAERQNRSGGKSLDHARTFLWLGNPNGSLRTVESAA
jgi:hypothetical protein